MLNNNTEFITGFKIKFGFQTVFSTVQQTNYKVECVLFLAQNRTI